MNLLRSTFYADLGCEQEDAVVGEVTVITETRHLAPPAKNAEAQMP